MIQIVGVSVSWSVSLLVCWSFGQSVSPSVGMMVSLFLNWHERVVFQRSAFGRSTAGNDVAATILISLFLRSPPLLPFLIEGVLGSKNLFSESCLERPKTLGQTLPDPVRHFGAPFAARLVFLRKLWKFLDKQRVLAVFTHQSSTHYLSTFNHFCSKISNVLEKGYFDLFYIIRTYFNP